MTWNLRISHNITHHALIVTRKWCFWLPLNRWSLLWWRLNWWRSCKWLRWRRLRRIILLLGFIVRTTTTSCLMLRLFILIPILILLLALIILVYHVLWRNTVVRWIILLLHWFIHFFMLTSLPCLMKWRWWRRHCFFWRWRGHFILCFNKCLILLCWIRSSAPSKRGSAIILKRRYRVGTSLFFFVGLVNC